MHWEVKLGLLLGIGVVMSVALVYYKPEQKGADKAKPVAQTQSLGGYRTVQLSPVRALDSGEE